MLARKRHLVRKALQLTLPTAIFVGLVLVLFVEKHTNLTEKGAMVKDKRRKMDFNN